VLGEDAANHAVEGLLRDHRLSRRQVSFALSPADIAPEPGDVIRLTDGPAGRFQIVRIEDGAVRRIEARETGSGDTAGDFGRQKRRKTGRNADRAFAPIFHLMDLARYRPGDGADFSVVAIAAKPWRRIAISSSPETDTYQRRTIATSPARIGRLRTALGAGPTATIDWHNDIRVRMIHGGLASVSALAMLNGANRLVIQAQSGQWEILAFARATEVSADLWSLTGLLRGLAGTEDAMRAGALLDAPLVMLDASVRNLGLDAEEAGLDLNWIAERFGSGGGRVGPVRFAGGIRAETPLAPVHLGARRLADGDIGLSWVRRSRIAGDGWGGEDIPLDEDVEAYRLQILDGETVRRTANLASNGFIYTASMQEADFGGPLTTIVFRVRQKGSRVALGIAAEATISL